jgi:hypothetical protein
MEESSSDSLKRLEIVTNGNWFIAIGCVSIHVLLAFRSPYRWRHQFSIVLTEFSTTFRDILHCEILTLSSVPLGSLQHQ